MNLDIDQLRSMVHGAVNEVLEQLDGCMLIGFYGAFQVLDKETGDRAVWTLTSPQSESWERQGLLYHMNLNEQRILLEEVKHGES